MYQYSISTARRDRAAAIRRKPWRLAVFVWFLSVAMFGCGGGPGRLHSVTGKVTVQGKPVPRGLLSFSPTDGKTTKHSIVGEIGSDGTYTVKTDGQGGAPAGKYKVTISAPARADIGADPAKMGQDPLALKQTPVSFNPKYLDLATTDLTVTVSDSPAADAYDLKLSH